MSVSSYRATAATGEAAWPPAEARIVISGDRRADVDRLAKLLPAWGYTRVAATTESSSVLPLCRRLDPHLLLLDLHRAAAEILAGAGTQFCPTVVEAFGRLDHMDLMDAPPGRPAGDP